MDPICCLQLLDGRTIRCNMAKYNPGNGPPPAPRGGYTDGYGGPRGPPDFSGGRGYGGRGYGRGGYDDGYGYGGRGRGGGRWASSTPSSFRATPSILAFVIPNLPAWPCIWH